jgi:hypothetical protein
LHSLAERILKKDSDHGPLDFALAIGCSYSHHHSSRTVLALAMSVGTRDEVGRVAERSVESSASAVEWPAIVAGALAAIGVTIILFALGTGAGLTMTRPWSFSAPSPTTFGAAAAIGLIVTQWVASALGGYLTGRLRTKWVGIRTDEIFFRDTAHGFLAWALATVLMAALFSHLGAVTAATGGDATMTGEAAEQTRKIAASFALFTSLSFFVGAFVASAAGALGGFHRDE